LFIQSCHLSGMVVSPPQLQGQSKGSNYSFGRFLCCQVSFSFIFLH
jgi:hypothetical protein